MKVSGHKLGGTALVTALLIVAVGYINAEQSQPPRPAGAATVRGRVLAADGDVPLRNVRVTLTRLDRTSQTVLSDPEGRFVFSAVRDGTYAVAAVKPGFVTIRSSAPLSIATATAVEGIEIRLPKGAAISGRLIDDHGDPVSGVTISAETVDALVPVAAGRTNDLGEYRLSGLPAGVYWVVANAGQALAALALNAARTFQQGDTLLAVTGRGEAGGTRIYYPGVSSIRSAQRIEIVAGEERPNLDLRLEPNQLAAMSVRFGAAPAVLPERPGATGAIGGRVLRQDGRPLSQAYVVLRGVNGTDVDWRTLTDDEGRYRFLNLPPGDYTVLANRKGYVSFEFGQRREFEDGQPIRVASGQKREGLDIRLPTLSALAGRVVDEFGEPVEGARVQVYRRLFTRGRRRLVEVSGGATQDTDDLGRFRIAGLQPGEYVVGAFVGRVDPLPMAEVPGYAQTYFPGTLNPSEAEAITIGLARDVVDVAFPLTRVKTASVGGLALQSSGVPFQGVVLLNPSERSGAMTTTPLEASTAGDGAFVFANLPPGEYVIQAYTGSRSPSDEGEFGAQFVTVNGADLAGLILQMSSGSTIAGRIRFEDSDPLKTGDIQLTASHVDPDLAPLNGAPARASVHDDWTFEMSGVSGPRRLRLVEMPAGWTLKGIYLDGVDVTDTPQLFSRTTRGVDVVLMTRPTEVSGVVTDKAGGPVTRCGVTIFSTDRERWYADSRFLMRTACGRGGTFSIRNLPPGEYWLAAVAGADNADRGDGWQAPELLEAAARVAMRIALSEGQRLSIRPNAVVP